MAEGVKMVIMAEIIHRCEECNHRFGSFRAKGCPLCLDYKCPLCGRCKCAYELDSDKSVLPKECKEIPS